MHQELGLEEFGGSVELNWTGKKTKNREGGYDQGGGEVCGCFGNLN